MAKSKNINVRRFANERKRIIEVILNTIKAKEGIKIDKLLAVLHVNEPFILKTVAFEYIKDMDKAGHIIVNKKTKEVKLCQ